MDRFTELNSFNVMKKLLRMQDADLESLHAEIESLKADRERLNALLDKAAPWSCVDCGPHIIIDEDGCCSTCGRDADCTDAARKKHPDEGLSDNGGEVDEREEVD